MRTTKTDLENFLVTLKRKNLMATKIQLIKADGRLGKSIALGYYFENALYTKTNYMTYNEMYEFLNGYRAGCTNEI